MNPDQKKNREYRRFFRFPNRFFLHGRGYPIQLLLLISFTASSVFLLVILTLLINELYTRHMESMMIESASQASRQTINNLEDDLADTRTIVNTLYYDVIKSTDLGTDTITDELSLLSQSDSSKIISLALYRGDGTLIAASPVSVQKENVDVTGQSWFQDALNQVENMHFSDVHVQDLFRSSNSSYHWVISLSNAVQLTENGETSLGVLLLDMNYDTIDNLLNEANSSDTGVYTYLCAEDGTLIYHPKMAQISAGYLEENNLIEAIYSSGIHIDTFNGEKRTVIVDSVAYTGWKMITIIPASAFRLSNSSIRYLILSFTALTLLAVLLLNRLIAARISRPLIQLNEAIANLENVTVFPDEVYADGSQEVQDLGRTLQAYLRQIVRLMDDIVKEEEEKRRSELDVLQAQINPHFLYNTLDSIVWMIEGEHYQEAVFMITQLASLFRISLNRGRTIISIENELKHAEAYLNIQKVRYKNSFTAVFDIKDNIEQYCTVKLIIQPILENAIYHGIRDAEEDGEIRIQGHREGNDILITVSDNGYGMSEEETQALLKGSEKPVEAKHGSGVGLINVHNRIRLRFGEPYGLHVESEPDEGTSVTIRIPAVPASAENMSALENGTYIREEPET